MRRLLIAVLAVLCCASVAWADAALIGEAAQAVAAGGGGGGPDTWYYTAAGATPPSYANIYENFSFGSQVTILQSGTATLLDFWLDDTDAGSQVKLALHNSSGAVVASCVIGSLGGTGQWQGGGAINQAVAAGTYYISANVDDNLWLGAIGTGTDAYVDACAFAAAPCALTPSSPNSGSLALRVYVD